MGVIKYGYFERLFKGDFDMLTCCQQFQLLVCCLGVSALTVFPLSLIGEHCAELQCLLWTFLVLYCVLSGMPLTLFNC